MSSVRNKHRRSFAFRLNLWFAATLTALALALFFAAYFLLSASIAQKDREVIRAQLDLCRSWYENDGLTGMIQRLAVRATAAVSRFSSASPGRREPACSSASRPGWNRSIQAP